MSWSFSSSIEWTVSVFLYVFGCNFLQSSLYLFSFSCQYGERCRFLHVIQQQNKPNPYGFGTQNGNPQQQQRPNPIGFGVQRGSQTKVASSFVTLQQNQVKLVFKHCIRKFNLFWMGQYILCNSSRRR